MFERLPEMEGDQVITEYLTTEELAAEYRTSPETIRYWKHKGKGPTSIKVGRRVLYERTEVDRWAAAHRQVSTGTAAPGPGDAA